MTARTEWDPADRAIDRELADLADSHRFLVDLTPVDLPGLRERFDADAEEPTFRYRDLEDDPSVAIARLANVAVGDVSDPTLATLLLAKQRELRLQLEMLACRGSQSFLALSIELYGGVTEALVSEASSILEALSSAPGSDGPVLGAAAVADAVEAELDRYRANAPDLESRVEVRAGTTGVMVSNGDVFIAPTCTVPVRRMEALLHHEVGTHVVTHVNGAHQPLRVLASGLAGHDEAQEGLAVLAEHLVGGLTAARLRLLAARVVAVHLLLEGLSFSEVHGALVENGIPHGQAFTATVRVFRSGGLTKDAVYLRGVIELLDHIRRGGSLDTLFLGKMPLTAAPLVGDLHDRGLLHDPLLRPRYLDDPAAQQRLARLRDVGAPLDLIGDRS